MKLNQLKCEVVDGTDAATLKAAVNSVLQAGAERQAVSVQYALSADGTKRTAMILYTE